MVFSASGFVYFWICFFGALQFMDGYDFSCNVGEPGWESELWDWGIGELGDITGVG